MNMRTTTDPITHHDVTDQTHCVYMGDGENGIEIYFENEANRQTFLRMDEDDDHRIVLPSDASEDYVAEG